MAHEFSDRPSIVTVPFRQTVSKAGEIGSVTEDTSTWLPLENGLNIKDGKLALSTSTSTVVTNAQTLYPQLWANTPAAWKSGSDLVIPAMGLPSVSESISITDFSNEPYVGTQGGSGTERIRNVRLESMYGKKIGNTYVLGIRFRYDIFFTATNAFEPVQIPFADIPFLAGKTVNNLDGNFEDNRNTSVKGGGGRLRNDGSTNLVIEITGDLQSGITGRLGTGTLIIEVDEDANNNLTPYIQLFDDVATRAIGLPDATAESKGLTTLNQVAVAPVNHIINGGNFNQRGGSHFDVQNEEYTLDRWKGRRGSNVTGFRVFQSTSIPDNAVLKNSIGMRRDDTAGNEMRLGQQIESYRCYQLAGKKATFGANFKEDATSVFTSAKIQIRYSTVEDESLGVFGGTFLTEHILSPTNDDTWRTEFFTFDVPSDCAALIVVIEYKPDAIAGVSVARFHEPRLYEGDKLYDYVRAGGTYAGELALCQRYFEKSYNLDAAPGALVGDLMTRSAGSSFNTTSLSTYVRFAARKRSAPTMTIYSRNGVGGFVTNDNNGSNHGAVTAVTVTDIQIVSIATDTSISAGDYFRFNWTADAEL